MSWQVANASAAGRFERATQEPFIMYPDEKAHDDGSGTWCSRGVILFPTVLRETIKRALREYTKEGILVETGTRIRTNGFTVAYLIDLTKVEARVTAPEQQCEAGSTVTPVQFGPGKGSTVTGLPGPSRLPHPPKTILRPPTRKRETLADHTMFASPANFNAPTVVTKETTNAQTNPTED